MAEALKKMITQHILADSKQDEWKAFRNKKLWTLEVNDVLFPNIDLCMQLMKRYITPSKKEFTFEDAMQMLTDDLELGD